MTDIYAAYWQGHSVPPQPSSGGAVAQRYYAPGGPLAVTVGPYSAAWQHRIYQTKPVSRMLWDYGEARNGATYDLGEVPQGAEVEFRIVAFGDGVVKTDQLTSSVGIKKYTSNDSVKISTGMCLFGVEDQYGLPGTDMDFNDMLLYVNSAGTGGVRKWNGSSWTNLTKGLGDVIRAEGSGLSRWFITDMYFINNKLWVTWWDDSRAISGAATFSGTTWTVLWSDSDYVYNGFVCWKNEAHIYGYHEPSNRWTLWKVVGNSKVLVATDPGVWNFYMALRGCVVVNPANGNELVVGDAYNDRFAYFNMITKQFSQGSSPGGSCVFALGVDNQKYLWAGDYGNLFYYSQDGHLWSSSLYDANYAELWEMRRWKDNLWGVGCDPCQIISRTSSPPSDTLSASWKVEHLASELPKDEGMGFMSFQETPEGLYLGFGGEPYYYGNTVMDFDTRATVYHWDGTTKRDIGLGVDWGDGVICTISAARTCRPGILTGAPVGGDVHMDPTADQAPRGMSGGR